MDDPVIVEATEEQDILLEAIELLNQVQDGVVITAIVDNDARQTHIVGTTSNSEVLLVIYAMCQTTHLRTRCNCEKCKASVELMGQLQEWLYGKMAAICGVPEAPKN